MIAHDALRPLDAARGALLRRMRWLRPVIRDRALRVTLGGATAVLLAALGTLTIPVWMLALGPVVLGVPHLLSDARYLVARPGLYRSRRWLLAVALPLLGVALLAHPAVGLLGAIGALWAARVASPARWMTGLIAIALAIGWPDGFVLGLAHAHNAVAVLLWWSLRPRRPAQRLVLVMWAAFALAISIGALDGPLTSALVQSGPIGFEAFASTLAPGLHGPLAFRVVALFCFAQSVHYAIWLRLVPDDARGRATPRSFAATARALRDDMGPVVLVGFGIAAIAVLGWATMALRDAHTGYLRLASFHGYLELAALATLGAGRGASAPNAPPARACKAPQRDPSSALEAS